MSFSEIANLAKQRREIRAHAQGQSAQVDAVLQEIRSITTGNFTHEKVVLGDGDLVLVEELTKAKAILRKVRAEKDNEESLIKSLEELRKKVARKKQIIASMIGIGVLILIAALV